MNHQISHPPDLVGYKKAYQLFRAACRSANIDLRIDVIVPAIGMYHAYPFVRVTNELLRGTI